MKDTLLIAGAVIGGYLLIHYASAKAAAAVPVSGAPANQTPASGAQTTLLNTGGSDLLGWLFGGGGNSGQTNSTSGTPVSSDGSGNYSSVYGTSGNATGDIFNQLDSQGYGY